MIIKELFYKFALIIYEKLIDSNVSNNENLLLKMGILHEKVIKIKYIINIIIKFFQILSKILIYSNIF